MNRPRGADSPAVTSPTAGLVGVPGTHPNVATGHTSSGTAATVGGMTTYPNLDSHVFNKRHRIIRRLGYIAAAHAAALAALGFYLDLPELALWMSAVTALWIFILSSETGYADGFRNAQTKAAERAISEAKSEATRAATERLTWENEISNERLAREAAEAAERIAREDAVAELRAELAAAETPRPIVVISRADRAGEGFIYVIRFSTGAIKVGQTVEPQVRLNKHRRDAEAYRVTVVDYWVSPQHSNYLTNETLLIDRCRQIGVGVKKEYFHGMDFADAVQIAGRLPYLQAISAHVAAEVTA